MTAHFEDGTEYTGCMLFGCDGSHSQVRREIFSPQRSLNHQIPVSMFGFTMQMTGEQARPIRELDPFFLQGTASASDVFMYISRKSRLECTHIMGMTDEMSISFDSTSTLSTQGRELCVPGLHLRLNR